MAVAPRHTGPGHIYAFLKLGDIQGEAQDAQFKNQIELHSFHWGAVNSSSFAKGTGAGVGKSQIEDMHFTKKADKSSPKLFEAVATGNAYPKATITLVKQSGETQIPYLKYDLDHVVVTGYQLSATQSHELPDETFSLHFVKVKMAYTVEDNTGKPSGAVEAGWDIQTNKKV
jgi:type VI secretion system secreted protein Hcp